MTKKQKRLSTIVSIMPSMSVSMISGLLIAEGTERSTINNFIQITNLMNKIQISLAAYHDRKCVLCFDCRE